MNPPPTSTEWLEHAAFLRRLAVGLVHDGHRADDAVQDAWLALAEQRERAPSSMRAWLAGAVRRLVSNDRREEVRRHRRERSVARSEELPAASDTAARLEVTRTLVEELDGLAPPLREALVMRFFDDLAPREIARRLDVPVNTVRSRVRRGIERLRERLGDRGRSNLLALVAPLAAPTETTLAWEGTGLVAMKAKLIALAGCIALSLTLLLPFAFDDDTAPAHAAVEDTGQVRSELASVEEAATREESAPVVEIAADVEEATSHERSAVAIPAWRVAGRAFGDRRVPRASIPLRVRVLDGYEGEEIIESAEVVTDDRGRFEWGTSDPGRTVRVSITCELDSYSASGCEALVVAGASPPTALELFLWSIDVTIRGFIHDEDGAPLAGAFARSLEDSAESDSSGRFELRAAARLGDARISVWAPGYGHRQVVVSAPRGGGEHEVDVELSRALVVHGRVLDADGRPVEGAEVRSGLNSYVFSRSDAGGRYSLDHLAMGHSHHMIEARKPGYVRARELWRAPQGFEGELDLVLEDGAAVSGRVVDSAGGPVAGADAFIAETPFHADRFTTVSRDDGTFRIEGVPPGSHTLWVEREHFVRGTRDVDVGDDAGGRSGIEVVLRDGRTVEVHVTDEHGEPVEGAGVYGKVTWLPHGDSGVTDAQGRCVVTGLPESGVALDITGVGILRASAEVPDGNTSPVRVSVRRSGGLSGIVLDDETGEPVTAFSVSLGRPTLLASECGTMAGDYSWMTGRPFTSEEGRWDTGDVPLEPGCRIAVEISAPGFVPVVAPRALVSIDPAQQPVVLRLTRGQPLHGVVVEAGTGTPIAGARVERFTYQHPLKYAKDDVKLPVFTDDDGAFTMEAVPPGEMLLAIDHDEWSQRVVGPFEMPARAPHGPLTLELSSGSSLGGRWLDEGKGALAGVVLELKRIGAQNTGASESTTDDSGAFAFEGLAPGTYELAQRIVEAGVTVKTRVCGFEIAERESVRRDLAPAGEACARVRLRSTRPFDAPPVVDVRRVDAPARSYDPIAWSRVATGMELDLCGLDDGSYEASSRVRVSGKVFEAAATFEIAGGDAPIVWLDLIENPSAR